MTQPYDKDLYQNMLNNWRKAKKKSAQIPPRVLSIPSDLWDKQQKSIDTLYRLDKECKDGKIHPDPKHVVGIIDREFGCSSLLGVQMSVSLRQGSSLSYGNVLARLSERLTDHCELLQKAVDRDVVIPCPPRTFEEFRKEQPKSQEQPKPQKYTRWHELYHRISVYIKTIIDRIAS